jgi:hypothetical protein
MKGDRGNRDKGKLGSAVEPTTADAYALTSPARFARSVLRRLYAAFVYKAGATQASDLAEPVFSLGDWIAVRAMAMLVIIVAAPFCFTLGTWLLTRDVMSCARDGFKAHGGHAAGIFDAAILGGALLGFTAAFHFNYIATAWRANAGLGLVVALVATTTPLVLGMVGSLPIGGPVLHMALHIVLACVGGACFSLVLAFVVSNRQRICWVANAATYEPEPTGEEDGLPGIVLGTASVVPGTEAPRAPRSGGGGRR